MTSYQTQQPILQEYLAICTQFPDKPLGKKQRKERHQALMNWLHQPCDDIVSIAELYAFQKAHAALPLGKPFCTKVIVPAVLADMEKGNIDGLRFLFENSQAKPAFEIGTAEDFVEILCAETGHRYNPYQLADMILNREPQNQAALQHKYFLLRRYFAFSIHEVPYGILNGMDFAEPSALPAMIQDLAEFAEICRKLSIDEEPFIRKTAALYHAYAAYLNAAEKYDDFADYLVRHSIPF